MTPHDRYSFTLEGTNGKGVVLVHGLTGIPGEMKFVAKNLHRAGYSVYAPLLAGHGMGEAALMATRWQDWLEGLKRDITQFRRQVETLYTAGICVGGKLGMMAAQQLPGVIAASAIYSPCFRFDGWNVPWYYKLAPVGLPVMMHVPRWRERSYRETETLGIKDARRRQFMQGANAEGVIDTFPAVSLFEMYRLGKALKAELPRFETPTLVLHAREDDLSHPRHARAITRRILGPHELHWVEDSYHMIHVDRAHTEVAARTAAFFARYAHAPAQESAA